MLVDNEISLGVMQLKMTCVSRVSLTVYKWGGTALHTGLLAQWFEMLILLNFLL